MRKAVLYNFLLEATIIASIAILLMLLVRKLFRKQLGNRTIAFAWLLVAVRLLCPLSLPNPAINEIRSPFASDQGIRPIAGQIKVRFGDLVNDLDRMHYRYDWDEDSLFVKSIDALDTSVYTGGLADALMWLYVAGAASIAIWFVARNIRFRHMLRTGRVEPISGNVEMDYHQLCVKRKVHPLPVFYTDPLPSACLVGVFQPYIALPLTSRPNETIQVLDHEICHFKGWDHVWGLVRLLCCIVHWFNPLVWLAASLSMTDCELACDERVTRSLSDDERKEYASVLVLAAARKNAPGLPVLATGMTMTGKKLRERVRNIIQNPKVVRWLAVGFAAVASLLLICAFCTSEYFPAIKIGADGLPEAKALVVSPVSTDGEAVRYAQEVWSSPYLGSYRLSESNFSAEKETGGYTVRHTGMEPTLEMGVLPDGTILFLHNGTESLSGDFEEVPADYMGRSWDELADYLLGFMDTLLPLHSNRVEAFSEGTVWRKGETLYASMDAQVLTSVGVESGYTFTVKLSEVPQVVYYCMKQPVHAMLWDEGMTDFSSPDAYRVNGLLARAYTDGENTNSEAQPPEDGLSAEDALKLAMDYVCQQYGETPETLRRFQVLYLYRELDEYYQVPLWQFAFECINPSDNYTVMVSSPDGELLYISGRDEGNG